MSDDLAARRARHRRSGIDRSQCERCRDNPEMPCDAAVLGDALAEALDMVFHQEMKSVRLDTEREQERQARQAAEARAEQAERDRDRAVDTVRALLACFTWHQSAAQSCTAGYHEACISGQEFEDIVQDLDNCGRTRLEVENARAERLAAALAHLADWHRHADYVGNPRPDWCMVAAGMSDYARQALAAESNPERSPHE